MEPLMSWRNTSETGFPGRAARRVEAFADDRGLTRHGRIRNSLAACSLPHYRRGRPQHARGAAVTRVSNNATLAPFTPWPLSLLFHSLSLAEGGRACNDVLGTDITGGADGRNRNN